MLRWLRLDNAAKIYPAARRRNWSNVFRQSVTLHQEVDTEVLKAALESDTILVVGWDVAISENGPLMIEGNRRPGFVLPQVAEGRGRLDIMEDVLASLNK